MRLVVGLAYLGLGIPAVAAGFAVAKDLLDILDEKVRQFCGYPPAVLLVASSCVGLSGPTSKRSALPNAPHIRMTVELSNRRRIGGA
jgi:hypothetical protein